MRGGRGALWILLALLGIVLSAGLTWSVVRLSGEHIGLASAPISVVKGLAPAPGTSIGAKREHDVTVTKTVTVSGTGTETRSTASTAGTSTVAPSVTSRVPPVVTSAVTVSAPSGSRGANQGADDGHEASRRASGAGRDD